MYLFSFSSINLVLGLCEKGAVYVSIVPFSHEGSFRSPRKGLHVCHWSLSPMKLLLGHYEKINDVCYWILFSTWRISTSLWKNAVYMSLVPFSHKGASRSLKKVKKWSMRFTAPFSPRKALLRPCKNGCICITAPFFNEGVYRTKLKRAVCVCHGSLSPMMVLLGLWEKGLYMCITAPFLPWRCF